MQELNCIFEQLKSINKAGIYRLVNHAEKRCYVNYSSNMAKAVTRLLDSNLFFPEFEFDVLEIVTNPMKLKIRCQYFKDLQYSNGYNIINSNKVSNWKLVIDTIRDFRYQGDDAYLFSVKIVSRGYKELVVGIFDTYTAMDSFINKYYPRSVVTDLVICSNALTKEYLNEKK